MKFFIDVIGQTYSDDIMKRNFIKNISYASWMMVF